MPTPAAAPERVPRCRYHNRRNDPCPNPALTDDPKSIRLCGRHAMEAVELLAEHGAITVKYPTPLRRSA